MIAAHGPHGEIPGPHESGLSPAEPSGGAGAPDPQTGILAGVGEQPAPASTPWRVAAVSPCFNRRKDIECLLADLARLDLSGPDGRPIALTVIIVDNASTDPLRTIPTPPGLDVIHFRAPSNQGGAGGFNHGMRYALERLPGERRAVPDFVWLIDSDARVTPKALKALVVTLNRHPGLAAVGSALRDPLTGITYEVGGLVDRRNGCYRPAAMGPRVDPTALVYCDYLAACSALVRTGDLAKTGLMPEVFLNGDDVELFLGLTRATGKQIAGDPSSVVFHPWRKFQTAARYYIARNSFAPLAVLGLGAKARFKRALLETGRAVAQTIMSAHELSGLHLSGLRDASRGRVTGAAPEGTIPRVALSPFSELPRAIREASARFGGKPRIYVHPYLTLAHAGLHEFRAQYEALGLQAGSPEPWRGRQLGTNLKREVAGAVKRLLKGPSGDIAVVPTGWPTSWFRGKIMIEVATDGFLVKEVHPWENIFRGTGILFEGLWYAALLAARTPKKNPLPPVRIGQVRSELTSTVVPPVAPVTPATAPSVEAGGQVPDMRAELAQAHTNGTGHAQDATPAQNGNATVAQRNGVHHHNGAYGTHPENGTHADKKGASANDDKAEPPEPPDIIVVNGAAPRAVLDQTPSARADA